MDRLTSRDKYAHLIVDTIPGKYREIINRLAAYEDTGLTPEEIHKSDEMLRAFIEHNRTTEYPRTLDWFLSIVKAEAEGRLIVLPCKVGDDVYLIREKKIHSLRVQGISICNNGKDVRLHFGGYPPTYLWGTEIGKTCYLTREEAEAALKEDKP